MNTTFIIGIDPGKKGAVTVLSSSHPKQPICHPFVCEKDMADFIRGYKEFNTIAVIEQVHSMPGDGHVGAFTFGKNYGFYEGILSAFRIPFYPVAPAVWQGMLGCLSGGDKNVTKRMALVKFKDSGIKITHAVADSMLIALYGLKFAR